MAVCAACGAENPEGARFCNNCAASLTAPAPERRKLATSVFCDLSGSTALAERIDAEALLGLMASYFEQARTALERHGGLVEKFIGDAVVGLFGVPEAHEDDALRACRAALEIQAHVSKLHAGIAVRIGVNTGEVITGGLGRGGMFATSDAVVLGDAVNVAARLEQAAPPGEVLIGESTYHLVRAAARVEPVAPIGAKGKSDPVVAYRLLGLDARVSTPSRTPLAGRDRELAELFRGFETVVTERSCRLATVVGEPGVGKSRLAAELIERIGAQARTVRGACLAYGEGITYWALAQIVRDLAGVRDEHSLEEARGCLAASLADSEDEAAVAAQLAQLLGIGSGVTTAEELAWAVRRFLAAEARREPVVIVVDDIQWAERALLDLLESLPRLLVDAPVLLVCLARPELWERAPEWEVTVSLEGLSEADVDGLLASVGVPESLRRRLAEVSAGNPLFAEELVAMLADQGALHEGGLEQVELPVTLNALLSARLDRLDAAERDVLERGAVEGEVFHRGAVVELSLDEARAGVPGRLEALTGRDFVRAAAEFVAGEVAFRFKHILVREAAYRATPKRLRAALHEQFAVWLERVVGDRVAEIEEILGYHLEQAYRFRCELGPAEDQERALGERAAAHLVRAARRASSLSDFEAVVGLLRRALSLGLEDPHEKVRALCSLGEALTQAGDPAETESVLTEAHELASRVGEDEIAALALVHRAWNRTGTKSWDHEDAISVSEKAIDVLTGTGDDRGLALATRLRAHSLRHRVGVTDEVGVEVERALGHARASGDKEMLRLAIGTLVNGYLVDGATPAGAAIERCEQLLESVHGDRVLEATVKRPLALFYAMALRSVEANDLMDEVVQVFDELNSRTTHVNRWVGAYARELAGDPEGAERELRGMFEYFRDLRPGEIDTRASTASVRLAHLYCDQGRWDEAAEIFSYHPEATSVRARLDAHDRLPGALELAEQAAAIRHATRLSQRATTQLVLAEVQLAVGLTAEADASLASAIELFELKGNLAGAAAAERRFVT
jgi:class 3 adenylate cyclase/tetratricopeptide (TPR) repeat protein